MTNNINKEVAASAVRGVAKAGVAVGGGMVASIGMVTATIGVTMGSLGAVPIVVAPIFGNPGFSVDYVKSTWKAGAYAWSMGAVGLVVMGVGTVAAQAATNKNEAPPVLSTIEKVEA
jgi:hypothetical protein